MNNVRCNPASTTRAHKSLSNVLKDRSVRTALAAVALASAINSARAEVCGLQSAVYDGIFVDGFNIPSNTALGPAYAAVNAPATGITPTISIVSPTGGDLAGGHVQIAGTVSGPPNVGVTVNGERAYVSNGMFLTRTLTFDASTTQLSAVATAPDALSASTSVTISVSGAEPMVTLVADAEVGFAPLPVRLSVQLRNTSGLVVQNLSVDYSSDGTPDYNGPGPIPLTTYTNPGVYTATVDLTLSDNSHHIVTRKMIAASLAEQRESICSVYAGLRARLAAQDAPGAAQSFTGQLHGKLMALFTALGPRMSDVSIGLGTLADGTLGLDGADVVSIREASGKLQGYPIHFTRDAVGVWRIDAM